MGRIRLAFVTVVVALLVATCWTMARAFGVVSIFAALAGYVCGLAAPPSRRTLHAVGVAVLFTGVAAVVLQELGEALGVTLLAMVCAAFILVLAAHLGRATAAAIRKS